MPLIEAIDNGHEWGVGEGHAIDSVQQGGLRTKSVQRMGAVVLLNFTKGSNRMLGPRRTSERPPALSSARSTGRRAVAAGRAGVPFPRASASPRKTAGNGAGKA